MIFEHRHIFYLAGLFRQSIYVSLNTQSSCFDFQRAGIPGAEHHNWPECRDSECFLPIVDYDSSVNHFNFFYSKHWLLTILLKYSLENYIFCEILSGEGCLPASVFKDYAGRVSKLHVPCAFLIQLSHRIGNGLSLTLTAHLIDLGLSGILPSCIERTKLFIWLPLSFTVDVTASHIRSIFGQ